MSSATSKRTPPKKADDEFTKKRVEEFVEEYTFEREKVEAYKKANKLVSISNLLAGLMVLLFLFSFLAIILIPLYSLAARFILGMVLVPRPLSTYLTDTPSVNLSTLFVVAVLCGTSLMIAIISSKISSIFKDHAEKTGLDSDSIEMQKLSKAYRDFQQDNYQSGINALEDYDHYIGSKYVSSYVDSARSGSGVDDEYVDNTFADFLELLLEKANEKENRTDLMLKSIVENNESEYCITKSDDSERKEDDYEDTYRGIIQSVLWNLLTRIPSGVSTISKNRPVVFYFAFLLLGVWLIRINSTLAVIVVTVLMGGFETWRKKSGELNVD